MVYYNRRSGQSRYQIQSATRTELRCATALLPTCPISESGPRELWTPDRVILVLDRQWRIAGARLSGLVGMAWENPVIRTTIKRGWETLGVRLRT